MKLFKNKQQRELNKQQKELKKLRSKQQQQAYKVLVGRTNSANYNYWERLITTCKVERDSQLMELLDFHCINYNLLKGGR